MKIKPKILIALFSTFYLLFSGIALASEISGTIISGGNAGYAWSDRTGWVNFSATNGNINITDSGIVGYAWNANYGWINMSPVNGGVAVAANGALSGYAWGSGLGWINFSGVSINSSGKFAGQANGATIGALTFDCANCSVTTDFRAQSFRTVAPAMTALIPGGAVISSVPSVIPPHINAYNVPLKIDNDQQSGTLTQVFTGGLSAGVDVPRGSIGGRIIINVKSITIDPLTVTTAARVISGALFDVTATDGNGNPVRSFVSPIRIALQAPEELQGRSDIGVYFFDEGNKWWERVSDAQFDGNIARFYVDHLTLFSIFSGLDLPQFIEPFFPSPELPLAAPTFPVPAPFEFAIPRSEIEAPGGEQVPDGEIPAEEVLEENPPLFDIETGPGPSESKKNKASIFAVVAVVAAGVVIYFLQIRKRKNA